MNEHSLLDDRISSQASSSSANSEEASNLLVKRARELVTRLITLRGSEKPPFLAEEYASLQGIKRVEKSDLGKSDAVLLKFSEGYVIKVNANHSLVRQNYSCAHEIAHTLLHELERQSTGDNPEFRTLNLNINSKRKERLCEKAAAELLMPESVFRKYLSRLGVSISSIEPLARIFDVSIPTAAIRIKEVSKERCIAIKWKRWQKARSSGFYSEWPDRDNVLKSKYVKNPSALLKAYESNSIVKSFKSFEIGHIRKRCYMESKGFGHDNMRYVISLVFPDR